ncbi:MAG: hypothetical protein CMK09_12875 [Ponticaulis sp.]|nr:hypothetical protein [Ponticaulis sp.]
MIRFGPAIALTVTLSGCVSVLPDNNVPAPEWFETRRAEVIAEGYPDLRTALIPVDDEDSKLWSRMAKQIEDAKEELDEAAPEPADMDEAALRAWVAEQQAIVAKGEEPY